MTLIKEQESVNEVKEFKPQPLNIPKIYDIMGLIETTSTAPTDSPVKFSQQFRIYKNGATKRFYWYDSVNKEWSYVTGT